MRQPPRQLSINDRPINPDCFNVQVWLDGVRQTRVTAYNQDEGWIERHITDENGNVKIFCDKIRQERINGTVEIKWIEGK